MTRLREISVSSEHPILQARESLEEIHFLLKMMRPFFDFNSLNSEDLAFNLEAVECLHGQVVDAISRAESRFGKGEGK
ncbi:MAG: hypothetical protein DSY80_00540 [Desulfocapsa sp.]|nr:MAG: hypothetical protein DSY80_00540 [Desulfocapsa sp.]